MLGAQREEGTGMSEDELAQAVADDDGMAPGPERA